jgi:hypothetical protein
MEDPGYLTGCRRTSIETASKLVELPASRVDPRTSAGGLRHARAADFRRMANVKPNSNCALCGELQSRRKRRLLN